MKQFKLNFKSIVQRKARWLLTLFAILILGVGQMWASETFYLKCNSTNWNVTDNYDYGINSHNGTVNVCMKSTYEEFKFYHYGWGDNSWMGGAGTLKPGDAGRSFYQKGASTYYNGNKGYVTFHMQDDNGHYDYQPWVWITRPKWYLKHNWNQGSWTWYELNDNNDGTYWVDGQYGAQTTVNHGPSSSDAGSGWGSFTATTVGSPVKGTNCRFKYDAVAGTVTITRLCKITYDKNEAGSGSAPAAQYVLYNTATATYTNTEGMTKTNMAFIGWNTQADGKGTHYDAGANITLTADKTLYAEWVPCWVLRGGDSGDATNGDDAMGNWTPQEMTIIGTNAFMIEFNLAASTTYQFKIVDRHNGKKADYSTWTHYGNNGTMTGTTTDWTFSTSEGNCKLSTGGDGAGTWRFAWNASSKVLCVYKKDDATKSSFAQGKYIYFDARTNTTWKANPFNAKFYFKNLATGEDDGDITCNNPAKLDDWVYYALVPADKTWGAVQMNNLKTSDGSFRYDANTIYARGRTSANQNCMVTPSSGDNHITLTWGTYCPPMSSATLSDNSTTKIDWQDAGNDGSTEGKAIWVSTSNTINVSGAATKALDDDNMTINYDFKVDGSSAQAGAGNTYSKGSLSNGTTYTITMDAYNTYNSSTGTKLTASQTLYYKAYNTYSVTNTLTNISSSGRSGDNALAHGVEYTATLSVGTGYNLPTTITVKRGDTNLTGGGTDYTYNNSTGALTINASAVTGNITIIASGVAKTYTASDNLDKNGGDSHGTYTATYDKATIDIDPDPARTNYHVEGYYLESGCTNKIADEAGNLVANVAKDAVTYTDGGGKWKNDGNVTLYTKWEENSFTVTVNAGTYGKVGDNQSSISVTGHPITASDNFTVTANDGYAFSHWTFSVASVADTNFVSRGGTNNATQTYNITATAAVTMTANYVVRYGLYGSLDNNDPSNEYGMPGWGVSADFTYSAGTYTCSRSLTKPNENYKFRVLDRRDNTSWGYTSSNHIILENIATKLSGNYDAKLSTAGRGSYTFTVVEVDDGAHPQVTITNPTSYVVHFGKKFVTIDGDDLGDLGGTITVSDAAGNNYADGKYIANGETVTVTASSIPTGYHIDGWWNSSSYTGDHFATANPTSWTVGAAVGAYAKFVENTDTLKTTGNWSTAANWSSGALPTINDVVIIEKPVEVNTTSAVAKRVIISNNGSTKTGKLTVDAGMKLIVAETIKKNDGSSYVETTSNDLVINSDGSNGVGALVWGSASTTPGDATVNFYSKSGGSKGSNASVNQFIGTPFTAETNNWVYNYDNSWLLGVDYSGSKPALQLLGSGNTMDPFKGYCVIYNGSTGHTYEMSGTLVTNADYTCSSLSYMSGDGGNSANENLLANSWLAPIRIAAFESSDFVKTDATIYIFNAGSKDDQDKSDPTKGQYTTIPIGDADDNVIPSMQSFSVYTNASGGSSVALDYSKLVYDPAVDGTAAVIPNKAPKKVQAEMNKVRLYVRGDKGFGDMVYMLEDAKNFTTGFDNCWDGRKMFGESFAPQMYALSSDGNMAVAAVPAFDGTILGFKAGTEDTQYTFSFEYNNDDDALYLYDIDTKVYTRVQEGNTYTFETADKEAHNRFALTRNAQQIATGVDELNANTTSMTKFIENGNLYILRDGKIYNATGALVK